MTSILICTHFVLSLSTLLTSDSFYDSYNFLFSLFFIVVVVLLPQLRSIFVYKNFFILMNLCPLTLLRPCLISLNYINLFFTSNIFFHSNLCVYYFNLCSTIILTQILNYFQSLYFINFIFNSNFKLVLIKPITLL